MKMKDRKDKTYVGQRGDVLAFVHWTEAKKYIPHGSFIYGEVGTIKLGPGERGMCSPEDLAKLIAASEYLQDEVCISLGAHAGIRQAEIARFRLAFVDMENRIIGLPPFYNQAKVTKVEEDRQIPIQPVFYARLKKLIDSGFPREQRVMRVANWNLRLRCLQARTGIKLPPNALRHGYGSHRKQLTQNPITTASEMGTSVEKLKNNYARIQRVSVSKAWFAV